MAARAGHCDSELPEGSADDFDRFWLTHSPLMKLEFLRPFGERRPLDAWRDAPAQRKIPSHHRVKDGGPGFPQDARSEGAGCRAS